MIVQGWERSLETSVILLLSAGLRLSVASSRGCPCLRTGVNLAIGLKRKSGIPLTVATLPPLHDVIFAGRVPRRTAPYDDHLLFGPRIASYTATARPRVTSRLTAQMKPANSRATAVMATVLVLPLRVSAR